MLESVKIKHLFTNYSQIIPIPILFKWLKSIKLKSKQKVLLRLKRGVKCYRLSGDSSY